MLQMFEEPFATYMFGEFLEMHTLEKPAELKKIEKFDRRLEAGQKRIVVVLPANNTAGVGLAVEFEMKLLLELILEQMTNTERQLVEVLGKTQDWLKLLL